MGSIEMHEPLAFGGLSPGEMPEVLVVEDIPELEELMVVLVAYMVE